VIPVALLKLTVVDSEGETAQLRKLAVCSLPPYYEEYQAKTTGRIPVSSPSPRPR